jgi:hypothetical protein
MDCIFVSIKIKIMTTINITAPSNWIAKSASSSYKINIYDKWIAFEDSQAKHKTFWYLVSMIAQGVLFLPLPAVLIYYFNAPILVLTITMTLFFANIIAGMGGLGIRTLISLFAISAVVHLIMAATFIF